METFHLEVWHWLILGGVLIVLEMFTTSFFSLLFGVAAIVVGLLYAVLPMHWFIQVILWLVLYVVLLVVWFQVLYPKIKSKKTLLGSDEIIGQTGMIIVPMNTASQSKVRFSVPMFGANEWVCRVADNRTVEVGERVKVLDILGNELLVVPMTGL